MINETIFCVTNHHVASCGKPPTIDDARAGFYRGYFENEHGEQAMFVYDHATNEARLYLGDAGWEVPLSVVNGRVPHLVLLESETRWLDACWTAAANRGTGAADHDRS